MSVCVCVFVCVHPFSHLFLRDGSFESYNTSGSRDVNEKVTYLPALPGELELQPLDELLELPLNY